MSDTLIKGQEMLKAMYSFQASLAKTLSFEEGDFFILHQPKNKHRNWWQVINCHGDLGFVPSNYVNTVKVDPSFILNFVEICLNNLKDGTEASSEKQEMINRLEERKEQALNLLKPSGKKQAPKPPKTDPGLMNGNCHDNSVQHEASSPVDATATPEVLTPEVEERNEEILEQNHVMQEIEDDLPGPGVKVVSNGQCVVDGNGSLSPDVDRKKQEQERDEMTEAQQDSLLYSVVDRVREHTGLSHHLSRVAVATVLDALKEVLPHESCSVVWAMSSAVSSPGPLRACRGVLLGSGDAGRLRQDLAALVISSRDAQQRAWSLHDDEQTIQEHIKSVVSVLSKGDMRVSRDVLSTDNYEFVNELVLFYQMETRWGIRELLIEAFTVMCFLNHEIVQVLCSSILVRELARDMLDNQSDADRLISSAKLMMTVLSMGDPLPLSHFEQLDIEFVSFLLELIEIPPVSDTHERIPDQFLALVSALNLQFNDPDNNLILDALQMRTHSKISTEKLLLLLNREDDPVRVLEHQPAPPNSILKLALDAFSRRSTAQLFYTNDTKVLLDITVRQLADLSAGDLRRALYLQLCLGILRHTDYSHCHRHADLLRCFTRIFCEEGDISVPDQHLVKTISNEFPQYFKA